MITLIKSTLLLAISLFCNSFYNVYLRKKSYCKLFVFFLILVCCSCTNKHKLEKLFCNGDIEYWDVYTLENGVKNCEHGFGFTKAKTLIPFEFLNKEYRILSEDCNDPEQRGCYRWSVSEDSILNSYYVGGIQMINMKIIKSNNDTILGKPLKKNGLLLLFVRVKELNSIVKQGDPRRKELLKGRFVPVTE